MLHLLSAVVFLLLVAILGILPLLQRQRERAVAAELVAHSFAWAGVLCGLLVWVPKFKTVFSDFDTRLPSFSVGMIRMSDGLHSFWQPILISSVLGFLAVDGVVFYLLWTTNAKSAYRAGWSLTMTAIPLLIAITITFAMLAPLIGLMNDLS